jgi:outer membrane biosynthesis protein TonB
MSQLKQTEMPWREQSMKFALGISLGLAIALSQVLVAQEPTPDKQKPKPEEPAPKTPEPDNRQQPQPNAKPNPQEQQQKEQKEQQKADKKQEKEQEKQTKDEAKKKSNEKNTAQQPAQKTQQNNAQAANGKGQRIPPQKFQASFGSQHQFRVRHLEDGRRFQYGGYWFELVEVWPAGWSYDDECYIDEDGDDYYLVDAFHPDMRVMVIVVEA